MLAVCWFVRLVIVCCVSLNKMVWFAFAILLMGGCSVLVGLRCWLSVVCIRFLGMFIRLM